jgi:hypothetical protein
MLSHSLGKRNRKLLYWASIFFSGGMDFPTAVRDLEERGFAGLAVPQVYGPPFVPLAVAATVTTRIQLTSGIAIGLTRSPFETAMAALDLDYLSQGRFVLGLGTGPVHWTKGYYGMPYDKPVSRLREVVQILRHVKEGARTGTMKPWHGDCHQLEFHGYQPTSPPYREHIPVWIAALRRRDQTVMIVPKQLVPTITRLIVREGRHRQSVARRPNKDAVLDRGHVTVRKKRERTRSGRGE